MQVLQENNQPGFSECREVILVVLYSKTISFGQIGLLLQSATACLGLSAAWAYGHIF